MAAMITTERFSTRVRKRITAISKGLSEILAGIAEPGMRYATIYMALATGITALNYAPLFNFCTGIVIAMPEFVLIGAFGIAENAHREGKKAWAIALFVVCFALAGIVLATFIDIFIVKFPEFDIKLLNFGRCLVAVSFSVILGKLDDNISEHDLNTQINLNVAGPDFSKLVEDLKAEIKLSAENLNGNYLTIKSELINSQKELRGQINEVKSNHHELINSLQAVEEIKLQIHELKNARPEPVSTSAAKNDDQAEGKEPTPIHRPGKQQEAQKPFNKKQFVLECLKDDPDLPTAEIKAMARREDQEISDVIISQARTQFKRENVNLRLVNE